MYISRIVFNIIKMATRFFNKIFSEEGNIISDKNTLRYWKNKIFYVIEVSIVTWVVPLIIYRAYMFYIRGSILYAIVEILAHIMVIIVITRKTLSIEFKKIFISVDLYCVSILVILTTGLIDGGMVCILASLILAGCLLEKKQILQGIIVNIIVFVTITALLIFGYFDGTNMEIDINIWVINVITTQLLGIIALFLMNTIYNGLENQNQLIKESKELLADSEIRYKAMIANIADVILILDERGVIKYNSPNLGGNSAWISEKISKSPLWETIHPEDLNAIQEFFQSLIERDGLKKTIETRHICENGMIRNVEVTAVNLIKDPNINGILINYHDITNRKTREDKILYLSNHDSLTGLYNRRFIEDETEKLDCDLQLPLSVITIDINGLKIINDSLGHEEGDKLLVTIAKILKSCCGEEDIVARVGGDEFNIVLPKTSSEVVSKIIERINSSCEEYNKKMANELYYISISIGSATKTDINESLDSIFKIAEDYMCNRKLLESRSFHSSVISSMKTALFEKSQETEEHAQRIVELSKSVGEAIGLTNQQFDELELFSTLHDIGKIGTDDQILNKPGKLTDLEWIEMKKHSEVGYRIAMASPELMPIAEYILSHHERFDGKGYPQGLAGEEIPLLSRILGVADAYDAMTEDRAYRKGMLKEEAISEIIKNSGTQFDPVIAKIFVGIVA